MNQRNMRLCLCQSCVGAFFESNRYRIFRANPLEVIKEPCDICHVRWGFDFVIKPGRLTPCVARPTRSRAVHINTNLPS